MFTYPVPGTPPGTGFVPGISTMPAVWANYIAVNFANAVDGIAGGYYQLAGGDLLISSDTREVKFNAPAASDPISLRGFVTIGLSDDVNYVVGAGTLTVSSPATFSSTVSFGGAMTFTSTVEFDGAVTFTTNGDITLESGCAVDAQSGSSITVAAGASLVVNGSTELNGTVTIDAAISPVFDAAKTYERTLDHAPLFDTTYWTTALDAQSLIPIYTSASVAAGTTEIVWMFRPPSGATVTEVSVHLTPAGAHGGVPVVTLAVATLLRSAISAVNSASVSDTSADVPTYETPHELTLSGLSLTFTEGDLLVIRLTPETGGNALVGLRVSQPKVSFTRTALAEE